MAQNGHHTTSFVLRVWLEDKLPSSSRATWRGSITDTLTREKHYVQTLGEILGVIAFQIERIGGQLPWLWRIQRRLLPRNRGPHDRGHGGGAGGGENRQAGSDSSFVGGRATAPDDKGVTRDDIWV